MPLAVVPEAVLVATRDTGLAELVERLQRPPPVEIDDVDMAVTQEVIRDVRAQDAVGARVASGDEAWSLTRSRVVFRVPRSDRGVAESLYDERPHPLRLTDLTSRVSSESILCTRFGPPRAPHSIRSFYSPIFQNFIFEGPFTFWKGREVPATRRSRLVPMR